MILFGASGHAKVILDIFKNNGVVVSCIYDDDPKVTEIFSVPVRINSLKLDEKEDAVISIGNNKIRKSISEKFPYLNYITGIHPRAVISEFSEIGKGTVIMANVTVNPDVKIGEHCILNTGCVIEHDCSLGDFVHISPTAALSGNVEIGEGSHIGVGASVIQGVKIGKWCTVGAGAAIINDVPDYSVVVGVPGRIIKSVNT